MKEMNYNVLAWMATICNIILSCVIMFNPLIILSDVFYLGKIVGVIMAVSIILLIVALRNRKNFTPVMKTAVFVSYAVAGVIVFRWILTILFTFY